MPKPPVSLTAKEKLCVKKLVAYYKKNISFVESMVNQLKEVIHNDPELMKHVHSTKWRVKTTAGLKGKLERKIQKARESGRKFSVTEKNLFSKVNDLAGFRILHLHTHQIIAIDRALRDIFKEYRYVIVEGPTARTWDDEHRDFFRKVKIRPIKSPKMYTSVHYILKPNNRTSARCEIQVRTLAEELWGEVDHTLNYPDESPSMPCREQIKVLARVTSSCSRLVDAIFSTSEAHSARASRKAGAKHVENL